jgi:hypothetical protein
MFDGRGGSAMQSHRFVLFALWLFDTRTPDAK